ncbi:retrotransposon-related protein [Trifolium pratense]|uniref:Retrotransposon-related protein n=1 Tax=Trifolium pratense TaxID=57577 RepID=A0A2K3NQE7_TRIPR|nr:retrotransposon-related protein [Trifolium pratense]
MKCAHFIAIKKGTLVPKLAEIYVEQVVKLHGIPSSIVSDRDPRFTSRFWESLQEAMGTKLRLSSAYHPQTDGQSERTIQSLEDLLRACVLEQSVNWDSCLPLIEFTYNNSYHSSIGMAPFEALYGRKCRTPLCWFESGESVMLGPEIVQETTEKIRMIREKMKASQSRQKSYHDKRRKDIEFQEGDHVFLRVTSTTGVGRALKSRKLTSRFIGPFQILRKVGKVAYKIALPPSLANLHDVFHVSQLRKYVSDPTHVIESDNIQVRDDLTIETVPLRIEGREIKKLRNKEIASVKVIWGGPAGENATWELESKMRSSYPELFSVWISWCAWSAPLRAFLTMLGFELGSVANMRVVDIFVSFSTNIGASQLDCVSIGRSLNELWPFSWEACLRQACPGEAHRRAPSLPWPGQVA